MDTDTADQENEVSPAQELVINTPKGRKKAEKEPPVPGDLVFAKVKGYPFWPARVESGNSTSMKIGQGKFLVFFFGTYELATCSPKEIIPFEPNKAKYGKSKNKKFVTGMKEIQETPTINCCPQTVTSTTVPVTPERPLDPSEAENGIEVLDVTQKPAPKTKAKKRPSANNLNDKKVTKSSPKSKKRKIDAGGDAQSEDLKETVEPTPVVNEPVEEAVAKAEKIDQSKADELMECDIKMEEPKENKSELTDEEKRLKKEQKAVEKERLKKELKEKKLEKKRKERIEQLKNQEVTPTTLADLDIEIMQSLNVESLDTARCLNAMSKLDLIQVNQDLLVKYSNILYTIKKCRKFKGDPTVRQKADYLFHKFKALFSVGVGESTKKLIDFTSEASQDSASSSSPTREDSAKNHPSIPAITSIQTSLPVPVLGKKTPEMPEILPTEANPDICPQVTSEDKSSDQRSSIPC